MQEVVMKRRSSHWRVSVPKTERVNEHWRMDFMADQLDNGRWCPAGTLHASGLKGKDRCDIMQPSVKMDTPRISRLVRDGLKRASFQIHRLLLRLKIAVYPVHYNSCAVDLIELEKDRFFWAKPSSLPGLKIDLGTQIKCLRQVCLPYEPEYRTNPPYCRAVELNYGPGFGYIEAQALYAVVRHYRPRQIIEVGSGISTYCAHEALQQNARGSMLCIEPHPSPRLETLSRVEENVKLLKTPVQAVRLSTFESLLESDILFIDSSHQVKAGSDVNHLILEVLPRLKPGVLVHFHDIYFPYDYQRDLLWTFLHDNETSLLRAFLCFNERFKILFCLSHLHYERPDALKEIFPEYKPQSGQDGLQDERYDPSQHFPSSIWLQVVS